MRMTLRPPGGRRSAPARARRGRHRDRGRDGSRRTGSSCASSAPKSPERLGVDELAEGVRPCPGSAGRRVVGGQLEEPAGRRAALVELAGGVEEARAVAGRRGPLRRVAQEPSRIRASAASRAGGRRDVGLQAGVAVRLEPRRGGVRKTSATVGAGAVLAAPMTAIPSPAATIGTPLRRRPPAVGRGTSRPTGRSTAARSPPRPISSSVARVRSLASSTFGWSNGSIPSTIPAIAVATSQRTNSPARSIGSSIADPDHRMAGRFEGAEQVIRRGAVGRRHGPGRAGQRRAGRTPGRGRMPPAARAARGRPGRSRRRACRCSRR